MTKIKSIKKPTNDKVFYLLFGKAGNEKITKDLIESITGEDIGEIALDRTPLLLKQ